MFYVGIDLHKKTITLCVVNQAREVIDRQTLYCCDPAKIRAYFQHLGPFQAVVEATASYEWLWEMLEPLAQRLVLAHPKKLRVIAESTRKSDKLDAKVLAEFLALGMIPEAYRPTARQRQHRALVRQRCFLRKGTTRAKNKIRRILSNYNADRCDLFSVAGQAYLAEVPLSAAERFVVDQLLAQWQYVEQQVREMDQVLRQFAQQAPPAEQEARQALQSIPQVGDVTIEVVTSELGDVDRFRSLKKAAAFAGLAPGQRSSAGKSRQLGISKEGSRLLRWALVQTAWRLVGKSRRWGRIFEQLSRRRGKKKAIVAVARRLLGVMVSLMRTAGRYRYAS